MPTIVKGVCTRFCLYYSDPQLHCIATMKERFDPDYTVDCIYCSQRLRGISSINTSLGLRAVSEQAIFVTSSSSSFAWRPGNTIGNQYTSPFWQKERRRDPMTLGLPFYSRNVSLSPKHWHTFLFGPFTYKHVLSGRLTQIYIIRSLITIKDISEQWNCLLFGLFRLALKSRVMGVCWHSVQRSAAAVKVTRNKAKIGGKMDSKIWCNHYYEQLLYCIYLLSIKKSLNPAPLFSTDSYHFINIFFQDTSSFKIIQFWLFICLFILN